MSKKYKCKKKTLKEYLDNIGIELVNEKQIIVNGFKTDYTIDIHGNVRSYKFVNTNKPTVLKPMVLSNGYNIVNLMLNGKEKTFHIHRLVAEAFIPNPENKPQVNHKDGDKSNNDISNLEWATEKENIDHAYNTGLKVNKKGEEHPLSKITEETAIKICEMIASGDYTLKEIAEITGATYPTVSHIKKKDKWKHISKDYDFSNYKKNINN